MIIKDIKLTQLQILRAKTFGELLRKYAPKCDWGFVGVKQDFETFKYRLRFLVNDDCEDK